MVLKRYLMVHLKITHYIYIYAYIFLNWGRVYLIDKPILQSLCEWLRTGSKDVFSKNMVTSGPQKHKMVTPWSAKSQPHIQPFTTQCVTKTVSTLTPSSSNPTITPPRRLLKPKLKHYQMWKDPNSFPALWIWIIDLTRLNLSSKSANEAAFQIGCCVTGGEPLWTEVSV